MHSGFAVMAPSPEIYPCLAKTPTSLKGLTFRASEPNTTRP
jgi:hypothetical protein